MYAHFQSFASVPNSTHIQPPVTTSLGTVCINANMSRKPSSTPDSDLESHDVPPHPLLRTLHLVDAARGALTAVGLLAGLSVLGVSADALATYRDTHLPPEFRLPLWPEKFNIGPTIALVVCSAVIVVANGASLALCRGKSVSAPNKLTHTARPRPPRHSPVPWERC